MLVQCIADSQSAVSPAKSTAITGNEDGGQPVNTEIDRCVGKFVIETKSPVDAQPEGVARIEEAALEIPEIGAGTPTYIPIQTFNGLDREMVLVHGSNIDPAIPGETPEAQVCLN